MNRLNRILVGRAARRDAKVALDAVEERIISVLGPRPGFSAVASFEHARVTRDLNRAGEINERREDLRRAEEAFTHQPWPFGLLLGIIFAVAVEIVSGILILRSIDVRPDERWQLGIGLALGLIGLTAVVSNKVGPDESAAAKGTPRRPFATLFLLLVYSVLVVAIGYARLADGNEDSPTGAAAPTIILLAITVAPAWMAESFIRRRRPARLLERQIKLLRRHLKPAERDLRRAEMYTTRKSQAQSDWDRAEAEMRATHQIEFRATRASLSLSNRSPKNR